MRQDAGSTICQTIRRQDDLPTTVLLAAQATQDNCPERLFDARTSEITCSPAEHRNYHWDAMRHSFLAADHCAGAFLSIVLCCMQDKSRNSKSSVQIRFRLFVLLEGLIKTGFPIPWMVTVDGCLLGEPIHRRPALPDSTRPC